MNTHGIIRFAFVFTLILPVSGPTWAQDATIPLWQHLEALDYADRENAVIHFETTCEFTPDVQKQIDKVEKYWNRGNHGPAINALRSLIQSGNTPVAMGISWKNPKPNSSLGRSGITDSRVESHGSCQQVLLESHPSSGNLFAVVDHSGYDNADLTVNISTDDGATWNESYLHLFSSGSINDLSINLLFDFLYIAYSRQNTYQPNTVYMKRFFAQDGTHDDLFNVKEVYDDITAVKDVALTSEEDAGGNQLYVFVMLWDERLLLFKSATGGHTWTEIPTGVTNAYGGLEAVHTNGSHTDLAAVYCTSTKQVVVLMRRGSAWAVAPFGLTPYPRPSISAWKNNIIAVYKNLMGMSLAYSASSDSGLTWTSGTFISSFLPERYHVPCVTARKGAGISVIYQEETGDMDTCWHTRCDYGAYNWSPPEPFNEVDVYTYVDKSVGTCMSIEPVSSLSGSQEYGMLWITDVPDRYAYFDRIDTLVEPLSVDAYAIYASIGGSVNFDLDAGSGHANRDYVVLGSITGTEPGFLLPGGPHVLPLNWDFFTDMVVARLNTTNFNKFLGQLDVYGVGTAQLNTGGALPPAIAGVRLHFAFCTHNPFDFVSNAVEIRFLP